MTKEKSKLQKTGYMLILISGMLTFIGYINIEKKEFEWIFYISAIIALTGAIISYIAKKKQE